MRDLKADMETCKNATPGPWMASIDHEVEDYRVCQDNGDGECICCLAMMGNWDQETQEWTGESKTSFAADTRFIAAAREGWPHAIERAIKAEAEVERLKKVYATTNDSWKKLQTENAQLRKVVEAARGIFLGEGEHLCSEFEDAMDTLRQALAELERPGDTEPEP